MIKKKLFYSSLIFTLFPANKTHKTRTQNCIKDPYNFMDVSNDFILVIFIRLNKTNVRYELIFPCEVSALGVSCKIYCIILLYVFFCFIEKTCRVYLISLVI